MSGAHADQHASTSNATADEVRKPNAGTNRLRLVTVGRPGEGGTALRSFGRIRLAPADNFGAVFTGASSGNLTEGVFKPRVARCASVE